LFSALTLELSGGEAVRLDDWLGSSELTNRREIWIYDVEICRMNGCGRLKASDVAEEGLLFLLTAVPICTSNQVNGAWVEYTSLDGLSAEHAGVTWLFEARRQLHLLPNA